MRMIKTESSNGQMGKACHIQTLHKISISQSAQTAIYKVKCKNDIAIKTSPLLCSTYYTPRRVCVSACYHSHGQTDRHTDLKLGMNVKWNEI